MISKTLITSCCLVLLLVTACREEAEITASIMGKWDGSNASFKVNPTGIIPAFTLDNDKLPVRLEFKSDGKLTLTEDIGLSKEGTYSLSGNRLTIEIDYSFELIDMSGTYEVKTLTDTELSAQIKKEGSYTHPDTGQQFDGTVTATLNFIRVNN